MTTITLTIPQVLDQVCREHYGDESGYVEAVLRANPGLAGMPVILPAGTIINLPDVVPVADAVPVVTLWS